MSPVHLQSAFSLSWHIFHRVVIQVLLLAGVGLIITTGFTGLFVVGMLGWEWHEALMLGALLSATDPVAVVALLKELGGSAKLGTLIEGESLLNDGTAIVLFLVFFEFARGEELGGGDIVALFFRLALGGPVLGLVWAWVTIHWVGRVFNDPVMEMTITLVSAYLLFYTAEFVLEVSGVLAVVVLGACFAAFGKTRISPSSEHAIHVIWETFSYHGNTLVFLLTGVIMVKKVNLGELSGSDWGSLFALYAMLHIIRALMVMMLFPLLRRIGYGMDYKSATMLVWGALRGAVSLALALIVSLDDLIDENVREKVSLWG